MRPRTCLALKTRTRLAVRFAPGKVCRRAIGVKLIEIPRLIEARRHQESHFNSWLIDRWFVQINLDFLSMAIWIVNAGKRRELDGTIGGLLSERV